MGNGTVDISDFQRLEHKLDKMAEAVEKLVLVEERQSGHTERLDKIEKRMEDAEAECRRVDRRIDKWLHLGMGGWTVLVFAFEAYRAVRP